MSPNKPAAAKVAAVVSAKVAGTAVARNLLRRRILSLLRKGILGKSGFLLVVTAKRGAPQLSFKELSRELSGLLTQVGLG